MKAHYLALLCSLFLLACRPPGQPIPVTRLPAVTAVPSTPTPITATPNFVSPSPTGETNQPTPQSIPTQEPTPEPITSDTPFTYESEAGNFTIDLPAGASVYEEYSPSVDGVFLPAPDCVSIIRFEPNFALTVHWTALNEPTTLADFVAARSMCPDVTPDGGEVVTLGGREARFYAATACGAFYTSYVYLLTADTGYVFTIQSTIPYRHLSDFIWEMLNSFTLLD